MKRMVDVIASVGGLVLLSPFLLVVMFLLWLQDFHSPFYIAPRVGRNCRIFKMVKLRSMVIDADKSGVDSTSSDDQRVTSVGRFVRKYKLDEVTQLWNVLIGDMSLVGPRPNVKRETDLYTEVEKDLMKVKPGITDFASIVFSDENDILVGCQDPDIGYNQLIRPWKSRLGLLYVQYGGVLLDIQLVFVTLLAIFSRDYALRGVNGLLLQLNAPTDIIRVSKRQDELLPFPPPGSDSVVVSR